MAPAQAGSFATLYHGNRIFASLRSNEAQQQPGKTLAHWHTHTSRSRGSLFLISTPGHTHNDGIDALPTAHSQAASHSFLVCLGLFAQRLAFRSITFSVTTRAVEGRPAVVVRRRHANCTIPPRRTQSADSRVADRFCNTCSVSVISDFSRWWW